MRVGTVTSVTSKDSYVEVKLAIDRGIDVPAGVEAVTVNTSLLTDRHVELTPAYSSGAKLKSGDVIGLGRTRTPVEFDRTMAMVDKLSTALGGDGKGQGALSDFLAAGSAAATGSGQNMKATLDQLSMALKLGDDNGAHTAKNIQSIVGNLAELTQAAADNDTSIRQFGSDLHQISDVLADQRIGTGSTGTKVNEILALSAAMLQKNGDKLTGTIADTKSITDTVVDMRREIAESFDLTPLLADNLYNIVDPIAHAARASLLLDKMVFQSQFTKELCNLTNKKQLGCATGTARDFGPDFGLSMMLDLMGGANP
jgi:phospholipid/cholesterol/gamma-HCH transport system substrate-binding protein